jgi:hypothetical protein
MSWAIGVIYIAWHFEQIQSDVKKLLYLKTKPIKKANCKTPSSSDWSVVTNHRVQLKENVVTFA